MLKITLNGIQDICVLNDCLTKWPQAYHLNSKSTDEVTQCILKLFYQFKAPKQILIVQRKVFVNEVAATTCKT